MSIWYRTRSHASIDNEWGWGPKIEEVEVLKSTSACVYIGQRRQAKRGEYHNFFETREEAVAFIVASLTERRDFHSKQAEEYEKTLQGFVK